jgi:integrase
MMLEALPEAERALWATAFYAELRRRELRALHWEDVDERVTVMHMRRAWDEVEREIEPKLRRGRGGSRSARRSPCRPPRNTAGQKE